MGGREGRDQGEFSAGVVIIAGVLQEVVVGVSQDVLHGGQGKGPRGGQGVVEVVHVQVMGEGGSSQDDGVVHPVQVIFPPAGQGQREDPSIKWALSKCREKEEKE